MSLQTASDLIGEANEAMVEEEYGEALEKYNEAIELEGNNASAFLHRSACHLKLSNYQDALGDALKSLELKPNNTTALFRAGLSSFHLEEFTRALEYLQNAKKFGNKKCDRWIRKCQAEIDSQEDVTPLRHSTQPPREKVSKSEVEEDKEDVEMKVNGSSHSPQSNPSPKPRPDEPPQPVRFSHIQSGPRVKVTFYVKNIKNQEDVKVSYSDNSFSIDINLPTGGVYSRNFSLFSSITPGGCRVTTNPYKVIVDLQKAAPNLDWEALESGAVEEDANVVRRENQLNTPGVKAEYPSSYKKKIDWDAVDKEAREDQEKEKLEGDAALNKLFSDIYGKADDDTKRAMIKSMQMSGGTCLSTNWKEVEHQDYEKDVQAPKGSEVHRYEY